MTPPTGTPQPPSSPSRPAGEWPASRHRRQPQPPQRRARHLATAAVLVATVITSHLWRTGDNPPDDALPAATTTGPTRSLPSTSSSAAGTPSLLSPARPPAVPAVREPIPSGGVAPISPAPPPAPDPALDPAVVAAAVVPAPADQLAPAELATPGRAAVAWLARWCPFDPRDPVGAAEQRTRATMTDRGWALFDPRANPAAVRSWQRTVAAAETGRCTTPVATVAAAAPRDDTNAVVHVTALRLITSPTAPAYVERVDQTRLVLRGRDGHWRVDLPADGG